MPWTRRGGFVATLFSSALLLVSAAAIAQPGVPLGQTPWELDADPNTVVLKLERTPVLLADTDRTQTVAIYADGRVAVHQPAYLRAAGDYQTQLSTTELARLLDQLDAEGLFVLDAEALQQERRALAAARHPQDELFEIHDGVRTSISMRLAAYTAADGKQVADLAQTLSSDNLDLESERQPSASRLAALAAAERTLLALTERDDLQPTSSSGE